jgi:ribosomal protein L11 methyltransferase
VLIANILAGPLQSLAELFSKHTTTDSDIILSGILDEQASSVITSYQPWFEMQQPTQKEEWVRIVGKRL